MKFHILTLFPEMVEQMLEASILGRAKKRGALTVTVQDIRQSATDKHRTVDDTPYGGGAGMVLRVDVLADALQTARELLPEAKAVLLTPQGQRFNQEAAEQLAKADQDLILIAGHYEGFDERIRSLVDQQISIGDFVVTGGELPSVLIVDSVARLLPGVLGRDASAHEESWSLKTDWGERLLEYPQYTRPEEWQSQKVPEVLLSGNHAEIAKWRRQNIRKTTAS